MSRNGHRRRANRRARQGSRRQLKGHQHHQFRQQTRRPHIKRIIIRQANHNTFNGALNMNTRHHIRNISLNIRLARFTLNFLRLISTVLRLNSTHNFLISRQASGHRIINTFLGPITRRFRGLLANTNGLLTNRRRQFTT